MHKRAILRIGLAGLALLAVGGLAAVLVLATRDTPVKANGSEGPAAAEGGEDETVVHTFHPVHPDELTSLYPDDPGKSFECPEVIPAVNVEAYYRDDLQARVAGPVKWIHKVIGSPVKKGEDLVEIAAPDLDADVLRTSALVGQRNKEVEVAKKAQEIAVKAIEVYEANLLRADKQRGYLKRRSERYDDLATRGSIEPQVADEARWEWWAAEAAWKKAKGELDDAHLKVDAARLDVQLKEALCRVAEGDLKKAQALQSFATLKAPFDGAITHRNVNEGSFVQNAASGNPEPLLTVQRTDIVTVVAKVPDNYIPYVSKETPVTIQLSELPGARIEGKVTRISPYVDMHERNDRTTRVEVDLWNRSPRERKEFLEKLRANPRLKDDLKDKGGDVSEKGPPYLPEVTWPDPDKEELLTPGMYGTMTLHLKPRKSALLIPSEAVVHAAGKTYIFLVVKGKVLKVAVTVWLDNSRDPRADRHYAYVILNDPHLAYRVRTDPHLKFADDPNLKFEGFLRKDYAVAVDHLAELETGKEVKSVNLPENGHNPE